MIKLLLTRVFPAGAGLAIFGAALSPVTPTLNLFAAAANALAGETEVEVDVSGLEPTRPAADPLVKKTQQKGEKRKKLEALADQLGKSDEDTFGWKAGDRGLKPIKVSKPPR